METRLFAGYYAREPRFGYGMWDKSVPRTREEFEAQYALVSYVTAEGPDAAWERLQADRWAGWHDKRTAAKDAGVHHTSMSVGDILVDYEENEVLIVAPCGFDKLELTPEDLDLVQYRPLKVVAV